MSFRHCSASLELEPVWRNILFGKFGGLKVPEATHVKEWLVVLGLTQNPDCRFPVRQLIPGIGLEIAGPILDTVATVTEPAAAISAFAG